MALLEVRLQVLHSHLVISTPVAVPKLLFLYNCICSRDLGPNRTDDKHNLGRQLWCLASTTSTVASLRVARLGWLPSQAKLPLPDGWRWTWEMCQWPWNVKWTIRKARASPTQTWIALGKPVATYNFAASPFLHYMISTQDHLDKRWKLQLE